MTKQVATTNPFEMMAGRLSMDPAAVKNLMVNTLMKAKNNGQVSDDELMVFMSIANEYRLSPLTKEIYAFNNSGAIQPIVSIDGWLKIINGHQQFDGMEFEDHKDDAGNLQAITCRIYRKDRSRATEVTEYLAECQGTSPPWKRWPVRMLRHKATIQAARYAFGLSGIIDPDEADRINVALSAEKDITPSADIGPALEAIQNAQSREELKAAARAAWVEFPNEREAITKAHKEREQALTEFEQAAAIEGELEEAQDDIPGI